MFENKTVQNFKASEIFIAHTLHSNSSLLLEVPRETMRSTLGSRSFTSTSPALWNSLPAALCVITTLGVFKSKLKTFLFRSAL